MRNLEEVKNMLNTNVDQIIEREIEQSICYAIEAEANGCESVRDYLIRCYTEPEFFAEHYLKEEYLDNAENVKNDVLRYIIDYINTNY